ncbi:unnamed protein product [Peronospora belbahrii]|uniref:Uncharacterized protein n=1 Tax=Peronospora belbahrii TaxID=622444 RepID=A0AAU9KPR3_9STRA|nr:unnamed protein product [Peronospora belbahrii]
MDSEVSPYSTLQSSLSTTDSGMTLTPIGKGSSTSTTFQLMDSVACNSTVSETIYIMYNKNRALFNRCVVDAQYQIFPFLGTKPSAAQVKDMSSSMSCIAVFTAVLLAGLPECSISGFPLKAAVETLLKIHVDIVYGWASSPSAERFQELLSWRRYVNLASEAGAPCDSNSELYAEYRENLYIAQRNSSIRMLPNYKIEYKTASGSWFDADEEDHIAIGNDTVSDDDDDTVAKRDSTDKSMVDTVSAKGQASKVSKIKAVNVRRDLTIANNSSTMIIHGVISILMSVLLSAHFMIS